MIKNDIEVLILGAGPTGLAIGCSLAAEGCSFMLVDRQEAGANTSRAAVIHSNTLEKLSSLGVAEQLLAAGHVVPRFAVRSRDSRLLSVDFTALPTRFPFTLMLSQATTEALLLARLEAFGGKVERPRQVIHLLEDIDGVEVTLRDHEGRVSQLRAGYVVGADGMHSIVRHAARISFDGSTYEQSFILADVRMEWGISEEEVNLFFAPEGFVVAAPLPGGYHRVVATVDEASPTPSIGDIQTILDTRGPRHAPAAVKEIVWSSRFRVHHRLAGRYHQGRLILAGDAAHVHSPAGGQGMNTGIVDACVLGPRLADVVAGRRDHLVLDEYEALRMAVAKRVLAMSNRMTRLATLRNPVLRSGRNVGLRVLNQLPSFTRSLALDLSGLRSQHD